MEKLHQKVESDIKAITHEWMSSGFLNEGDLFVVGCSTSEVIGEHIGTAGSEEVAAIIYEKLAMLKSQTNIRLAFQCCEHLNRALVVERETMNKHQLEEVAVIPAPTAGGSMASYAYKQMKAPVVVEKIQATAGIDIGETMIGMHLKRVAVPLRFAQRQIGNARLTAARTRPKLIGGERAIYK
ncbi:TIGR01440 family protein [Lentibacillus sp. Marseille-P4043]|uniref:TIGR01440 family protein n=1 Tax=Lentibacillus sp. Marseille-P4043 TaxID=2040293 RepID=UPI000D0B8F29